MEQQGKSGAKNRGSIDKTKGTTCPITLVGIIVYGYPRDQNSTTHVMWLAHRWMHSPCLGFQMHEMRSSPRLPTRGTRCCPRTNVQQGTLSNLPRQLRSDFHAIRARLAVNWGESVGSPIINRRDARFQVGQCRLYSNHLFVMLGLVRWTNP